MARAVIYIFFCLIFALSALASSHIAQFVFTTEPRRVAPGEISEEITIQAQDSSGNTATTSETTDLEFLSTSLTGEFLNSSGDPVRTIMNKGTANRTFYYRDSTAGAHTLRVKAIGRDSGKSWEASQQIIISSIAGSDPAMPSSPPPSGAGAPSPSPSSVPTPTIKAYAGEDKTVAVGSEVNFVGSATGLDGKPLETARFWWNFGDGESKEGRSVGHIFMIPGLYTVGLHVSSGEYAASDYLKITVIPNQIEVSGVVIGEKGYLKIRNPSAAELDIGGWLIEDSNSVKFTVPPKTRIAAGAETAFANSTTGFFLSGPARLTVYYLNLTKALEWEDSSGKNDAVATSSTRTVILSEAKNPGDPSVVPLVAGLPPAEGEARLGRQDDGTENNASSSKTITSELAQVSNPSPAPQFLFWIAFVFSILAAAGFLVIKHFLKF